MSSWAIVALVAIVIWGIVASIRARSGNTARDDSDQQIAAREDGRTAAELEAARREVDELKERVKVLERIATDSHSGDAREQARISAEIEALRGMPAASKEEPGQ